MIRDFFRKLGGGPDATARVALFGKHPGWPDHMPDLGLVTERLVALKQFLYHEVIGRNITSGRWSEGAGRDLIVFDHLFARFDGAPGWLQGRIWASRDGSPAGRAHYPMVATAECEGLAFEHASRIVSHELETLARACAAAPSGEEVRSLASAAPGALAAELSRRAVGLRKEKIDARDRQGRGSLGALSRKREMGPDLRGLVRLMHRIEADCEEFRREFNPPTGHRKRKELRAHHFRAPRCATSAAEALALWSGVARELFHDSSGLWIICPAGHEWVDLVVGPAGAEELACLRLGERTAPLTTDVPYETAAGFVESVRSMVERSAAAGS